MNETRIYADAFETTFANPKEMLDFLAERAKVATWIRKPTRSLRLVPISQEAEHALRKTPPELWREQEYEQQSLFLI